MQNEPLWPDATEIIRLNQLIVDATGEPHLLINGSGLESACARPNNLWAYEGEYRIAHLAAALIAGIGQNHPFAQGNKRTALGAAIIFIENNGYIFDHPDTDDFGPMIEAFILRALSEEGMADELDQYLIEELF